SRRRHTISDRDWSSDVCSSDLSKEAIASYPEILKAEPQLLHDFGIRRDGFFRFTGKRHPYAGDMHHNGDRTDRQLTAGLSQTVSPPVGPDDRLRDGTSRRLKLKWNAVRVAQHLHRLVFAQVNISHCGEKLIDFLLL